MANANIKVRSKYKPKGAASRGVQRAKSARTFARGTKKNVSAAKRSKNG